MYDIFYKIRLFGYQKFEIETLKSKSEVIGKLREYIETEDRIIPGTGKRCFGQVDSHGFQFEHLTNRRLPVYGIFRQDDSGVAISVTMKESAVTIIALCLFSIFILFITFIRYKTLPMSVVLALLLIVSVMRTVLYVLFRLDVASIRRSLMKMFS